LLGFFFSAKKHFDFLFYTIILN